MPARSRQRGFSLLEVLVAFVILAMSLSVIYRIFSGGLRNVALTEDYAHAELIAQSQLSAAGVTEPLLAGVTSGQWNKRYRWERIVEHYRPWEQDVALAAPLKAYKVIVRVYWEHKADTRHVSLSTVRLGQAG